MRLVGVALVVVLAWATAALATPIAHNDSERAAFGGRVIPEPMQSVNYVQFGAHGAEPEFKDAFTELHQLYPRYIRLTTVADELHDPNAVSTGPDGIPAGMPGDTGDGHPLYVVILTDTSVPDAGKQYVSLMFAHSAEPCGREGELRAAEDLAKGAAQNSPTKYDDAKGTTGETHSFTARELLAKTKIFIAVTSPDGWAKGDNDAGPYDQNNGAGINSNRVAPQDGWAYTGDVLYRHGYSTATQSEGLAFVRYLLAVRDHELHGKPFSEGADMHGPLPMGYILLHDQGNDAAKVERNYETAVRVKQAMDGVQARYATGAGASGFAAAASQAESVQRLLAQFKPDDGKGALDPTHLPLQWATFSQIWDILGYTAGSSWGGWMNSHAGLDADAVSYEINCVIYQPYDPAQMQLFVDNVRAILDTTIVRAAARGSGDVVRKVDLQGPVGFYDDGARVTSVDGNPSPPPDNFPNRPLLKQVKQVSYDVSQTDWFRQVGSELASTPVRKVRPGDLAARLPGLATLAVADQQPGDTAALKRFVTNGGNLVLTDSALKLLPALGVGAPQDVKQGWGYVGYAELDFGDPLAKGIPKYARQTYDPIGLGMPTLMERDFYYGCKTGDDVCQSQKDSGTQNSAPIWWVDKSALGAVKGLRVVGTVDPPASRKGQSEGSATDKVEIAVVPMGAGRIVFFGAALPRPTEAYPHWYGLDAQTVSHAAQTMLLRAMTWRAPGVAAAGRGHTCHSRRRLVVHLHVARRDRLRSARVVVNGRAIRTRRGRRAVFLDLSGRLAGRYTVRISASTVRGRTIRQVRRYRTCAPQARRGRAASRDVVGSVFRISGEHFYDPFSGVFVTR